MKKTFIGILYEDQYRKEHLVFTEFELKSVYDQSGHIYFKVHTFEDEEVYIETCKVKKIKVVEV